MSFKDKITEINISDINLNDDLFRFSYPDENIVLEKSITEHGLIYPIMVKKSLEKFQIVCGFRRILIAKKFQYRTIPAIVTSKSDKECFDFAVSDTLSQRALNVFEVSAILDKLIRSFGIDKHKAESIYLPVLGYNPNKKTLDNLLFIKKFSDQQRKKFFSLNIEPKKIFVFKMVDKSVWDNLITILTVLRPSANKFRQIIELIKEISQRENIKETELLNNYEIQSIIKDDKKTSSQNLNLLRIYLETRRNPLFARTTEYFKTNLSLLKLSGNIKLNHPSNFENNNYSININFRNENDLKNAVSNLEKVCNNPILEKILNPLKNL